MDKSSQSLNSGVPDGSSGSEDVLNFNGLVLKPVAPYESGQGLPYAPADWPDPGDNWGWRAGTRTRVSGFMQDRFLTLPSRLRNSWTGKKSFRSKRSVQEYLEKVFPNADIDAFFSSFSWKMPSSDQPSAKGAITIPNTVLNEEEVTGCSGYELEVGAKDCKVGNDMCRSPQLRLKSSLPAMECDICCSEPGFCRSCCCILCSKTIECAYQGYSFIRCEAAVDGSCICGHAAHIDCALRSGMAGTVGGGIEIDVEYYCRRCDKRTDLVLHVTQLLQVCESLSSRDEIGKILNLGFCILRDSQKESAKRLQLRVQLALKKLRSGICLEHIWNMEENSTGATEDLMDVSPCKLAQQRPQQPVLCITSDWIEPAKLYEKIDMVLHDLKKSQENEYRIAEDSLDAQKELLLDLYQQVEVEKSSLASGKASSTDCSKHLVTNVLNTVSQIKQESLKLKDMKVVAKGFGRVPKSILKEHFGVQIED